MKLPPKKCYFWAIPAAALIIFLWWYFLLAKTSILETLPCCKLLANYRDSPSPNSTVLNKTSTLPPYLNELQKVAWSILDVDATVSLPVPHIGSYQCQDQICSEFLSATDVDRMKTCINPGKPASIVPKCHFMNGTHRSPVALVSFPGSGNTWVRGLLEKVTGICTGLNHIHEYLSQLSIVISTMCTYPCMVYLLTNSDMTNVQYIYICLQCTHTTQALYTVIVPFEIPALLLRELEQAVSL